MNRKLILYIVIAIALILLIWWIWKKITEQTEAIGGFLPGSSGSGSQPTYPVKLGSRGTHVKELQRQLNILYISKDTDPNRPALLDVDGIFGPLTEAAVIRYLGGTRGNVKGQISFSEAKSLEKKYEMETRNPVA